MTGAGDWKVQKYLRSILSMLSFHLLLSSQKEKVSLMCFVRPELRGGSGMRKRQVVAHPALTENSQRQDDHYCFKK